MTSRRRGVDDPGSPLPRELSDELRRVVGRWQQLPLDHALSCLATVHGLVQRLADEAADAERRAHVLVPDLGPAAIMDQLTVVVVDAVAAGPSPAAADDVQARLRALRGGMA